MKSSTKSVLFALAAAGVSAVMTVPATAQVFKPREDQTCDNPSTARDKSLKPETRCLLPKSGPLWERFSERWINEGRANANKTFYPGGPQRRDYVPADSGSGGGGGGSSKGKKPR
jgi:hypothetical protein